jgi:hypothetical protein
VQQQTYYLLLRFVFVLVPRLEKPLLKNSTRLRRISTHLACRWARQVNHCRRAGPQTAAAETPHNVDRRRRGRGRINIRRQESSSFVALVAFDGRARGIVGCSVSLRGSRLFGLAQDRARAVLVKRQGHGGLQRPLEPHFHVSYGPENLFLKNEK